MERNATDQHDSNDDSSETTNDRKMPAQSRTQILPKTNVTTRSPTNNERNINISSPNTEETIVESSILNEEHKETDQHAINESGPESNVTNTSSITFSKDNNRSIENKTENSDSLNIETHLKNIKGDNSQESDHTVSVSSQIETADIPENHEITNESSQPSDVVLDTNTNTNNVSNSSPHKEIEERRLLR